MSFSNLKIGVRLASAFAMVLVLSIVLGLFSIGKLGVVNDATAEIATNWLVATRSLGAYETAINEVRRGEAQHLMANKEELFVRAEKIVSDSRQKAAKALKEYGDTVTPGEEQKLYAAIQAAQERYFATQPGLLKLSRASDGVNDALRDAYNGASRQTLRELIAAVEADIAFQTKGSDIAYQTSQNTYASTRDAVVALLNIAT